DHLNNVEQIVINSPQAGTYQIHVAGFDVPVPGQKYFVAYDFQPEGLKVQYPFEGVALSAGDSTLIFWEAASGSSTFSVDYSTDNGSTWANISNNIPAEVKSLVWYVPSSIQSAQCKVRVLRNDGSGQAASGAFTIIGR